MVSARTLLVGLWVALATTSLYTNVVYGCSINIVNSCPYPVTACAQSGPNPIQEFQLVEDAAQLLDLGTACQWIAGAIWASVTGQCANPVGSNAATDRNLANLAEFTIGPGIGVDTYDLSNVDAYTIGLAISINNAVGASGNDTHYFCNPIIQCSIDDISSFCQPDNVVQTFPSSALSCINTDGAAGIGPTSGTEQFKAACPDAYSYNYDDRTSIFTCGTGSDYTVTFCP